MANDETLERMRNERVAYLQQTLNKSSELLAFIVAHGSAYDRNYMAFVLNINNIVERFLETYKPDVIDKLYAVYDGAKKEGKTSEEVFECLRQDLYKLSFLAIRDSHARTDRNK